MARGFESKQVESQQEEAARPKSGGRPMSAAEIERYDRQRTLELSRSRLRADLAHARNDAHRRMLEQALAALEEQLRLVAKE